MDYEKLTKDDLVRIIEGIRSPRYAREKSNEAYLTRILEALLLERYEIESQMHAMKESLLEIEKSLQEHIDLFDKAPAAYVTLNSSGCVLKINQNACAVVGKAGTAVAGLPFSSCLTRESRRPFRNHFTECRGNPQAVRLVNLSVSRDNVTVPITLMGYFPDVYRGVFIHATIR
jgi:PAS domain-containing protein